MRPAEIVDLIEYLLSQPKNTLHKKIVVFPRTNGTDGDFSALVIEACFHDEVEFPTHPGVSSGVVDLSRAKGILLPVGELSRLGDTKTEEDGGKVAQTSLLDFKITSQVGEIFESPWFEFLDAADACADD